MLRMPNRYLNHVHRFIQEEPFKKEQNSGKVMRYNIYGSSRSSWVFIF